MTVLEVVLAVLQLQEHLLANSMEIGLVVVDVVVPVVVVVVAAVLWMHVSSASLLKMYLE